MIDNCDRAEFIHALMHKARKTHRCGECFRDISAGEQYESVFGKWEGDFSSHKTCVHCCAARKWLERECNGYVYGGIKEDIQDHFYEVSPYKMLELGRLIVGMRRKWRDKRGRMMPVPVVVMEKARA